MPPLPPAEAVAIVRVMMDLEVAGEPNLHQCENVHHIKWAVGTAADADMAALATNWWNFYKNLFDGTYTGGTHYICENITLTEVTATDLSSDDSAFGTHVASQVGAASQIWPANTAFLFSQQVRRRFRGGHGRTYLPGVSPDNTTDGRSWTTGAVSDLQNWWSANFGPVVLAGAFAPYPNISGLSHVLVSYFGDHSAGNPPPYRRTTPLVDTVTTTVADSVIRSQRRRVRLTPTPT